MLAFRKVRLQRQPLSFEINDAILDCPAFEDEDGHDP
jgi:hypothetical protein